MLDETVKICLVQPPSVFLMDSRSMPPLGILYLASWLRKDGHEVNVIDLAGADDWKSVITAEAKNKLDDASWAGITATTPQYNESKRIAENIRTRGYNIPIVVGGIHTTSLAHQNEMDFIEKDGFDSYCIGEGYNAVTKICKDIQETGKPRKIYTEPILKDVNELPFAARDLIDLKSYTYRLGNTPSTTFYSQYGCIFSCQYCESPLSGSFTVRAMTPQRIQDEIRYIRDTWGIRGFHFFDDELNLDLKRTFGICEKLKELGDIVWRGFMVTAPSKNSPELFRAMKESGCYEVASGIESGSDKILKAIKKPATVKINRTWLMAAKHAGLRTKAFFIIGLPNESWDTILETDRFLESLKAEGCAPDDCDFSILQIYKGSPLYRNPQDIEFDTDYDKGYYKSVPGVYEDLVQVRTAKMTKLDLISARNMLEEKWKPKNWVKDNIDRKDLDRVYSSIRHAKEMLSNRT